MNFPGTGLLKDRVILAPFNPDWATIYKHERNRLYPHIKDYIVAIEHVGSTSIIGIQAKPIIDIAVAIPDSSINLLKAPLLSLGYLDRGDKGVTGGGYLFVLETAPLFRVVHLHVVPYNQLQWVEYLKFRDILNHSPHLRQQYEALKIRFSKIYAHHRGQYTLSKSNFIKKVLLNAV